MRRPLVAALALALAGFATPAAAASHLAAAPRQAAPPQALDALVEPLRVATRATLRWWGLHVYDAELRTSGQFDPARPETTRFVLELTYAREIEGPAIARASRDEIARLGFGTRAQRESWFAAMQRLFPDVGPGRRIAGVNLPGEGALFFVDGRFAGRIDDPEFARAFFAIWLDARTAEPSLRARLLGARASGAASALASQAGR